MEVRDAEPALVLHPWAGSARPLLVPTTRAIPAHAPAGDTDHPHVIVCAETETYRRIACAAAWRARADSASDAASTWRALEIGSDLGAACALISRASGRRRVIGVDLSESSVAAARARFPALQFEQMDVFEAGATARLRELGRSRVEECAATAEEAADAGMPRHPLPPPDADADAPFALVCIDVNGNRPLDAVAAALSVANAALRPPLVVVKSRELWRHVADRRGESASTGRADE